MKYYFAKKAVSMMKKISHIILAVLSVVLAVLLAVTSLYAAALYTVRSHYTPEYVYNFMNSLDYASLEVPDGNGGSGTVCDLVNQSARDFRIQFSEQDINTLVRTLSLDAVITSFVQDLRTWAFDNGAAPRLDADETADTILSGIDSNVLMFLSMFGDVNTLLSDMLSNITEAADFGETFEEAEPYRELLSQGTLTFVLSVSATLVLLILVTRQLKIVPTAVFAGSAWIVSGSLLLFANNFLAPFKTEIITSIPESTFDLVYLPLMEALHRTGTNMALTGLAIVVIFTVIGSFSNMIKREKQRTAEAQAKRAVSMNQNGEQF